MADLIIPRGEVQPGDLLLHTGQFVTVMKVMSFDRDWGAMKRSFTDIEYRYPGKDRNHASDWPSDQLEAVRRSATIELDSQSPSAATDRLTASVPMGETG